jgi:hypothetical protein
VTAAGGYVERTTARGLPGPLDDQVEILAFAVGLAVPVELRPLTPDPAHAASSTARFAASSIVGSV